jgi:DNA-binding MarR family transcriptional regulator
VAERGARVPLEAAVQQGRGFSDAARAYEGLVTAFQAVNQAVKEALAPFGMTPAQFGALRRIDEGEEISLSELARRLGCTNANVTRLVEHMAGAGFLERTAHPWDQRVVLVRMTSRGASVRRVALSAYSETVGRVMGALNGRELSTLGKLGSRLA